jgi:hypothetical protein
MNEQVRDVRPGVIGDDGDRAPRRAGGRRPANDLIEQPLFLVGSERSGTTLLRLMLDHHPQIACSFEFDYAVAMMPDSQGWPDLNEYHAFLATNRPFQTAGLTIDPSLDYPRLIDSFLRQKWDPDRKPWVGATVHYHFDRLLRIWPDARFIHIVRDGRDVGRSVIELGWAGNMYIAVEDWIEAETLWARLCPTIPAHRRAEVRYETLVSEPEAALTRLCAAIGVPYDPAMLSYPEESNYGPPSPRLIGQWKRKLSPDAVRLAEARIGPLLVERGYELSGYPPLEVTPRMEKRLRRQSRWHCAMVRRRRFGTALFLADFLTRRLGPRSWQASVQDRLNVIRTRTLK